MRRLSVILGIIGLGIWAATFEAAAWSPFSKATADNSRAEVRIGLSLQPSNALVMIALDREYFAKEGLKITVRKFASGTRALRNGLLAGKVDLTTASDVPIVLNRFERRDYSVIATIFRVDNQNRIVARRDKGVTKAADLAGRRIATQRGSAVHFFLHLFLLENDIPEDGIRLSFMKAGELPQALARGDIDAFSMREPYIGRAMALLGDRARVFAAPGLYSQSDQVVIDDAYLKRNPKAAEAVLRALLSAEKFAAANPEKGQAIVARRLGVSANTIMASWPQFVPRVSLDQPLLLRLEDIGRWALRRGIVPQGHVPNFLKMIHFDALQAVKPGAITVVR